MLRGTVQALGEREASEKPHYQIKVDAGGTSYRIAVNVRSEDGSEVYFASEFPFNHYLSTEWLKAKPGFTTITGHKPGMALDYIREGLFDWNKLRQAPDNQEGDDNDVQDAIDGHLQRALKNPKRYEVFAFGAEWNNESEPNKRKAIDKAWDVWRGVHEIHQNQGNPSAGGHAGANGIYQDGGLFVYDHDTHRWAGFFFKFRSQAIHTDANGNEMEAPDTHKTESLSPGVQIVGAMVNPPGDDRGKETVTLANATDDEVSLKGWKIIDKNGNEEILGDVTLEAGQFWTYTLSGDSAQFSNSGGTITLADAEGRVIDRESYSKRDASRVGQTLTFG